jgi:FixJ family two-component response regulator
MPNIISKQNTHVVFIDNDDSYIRDLLAKLEEVNEYNIKIYSRTIDFFDDFKLESVDKNRTFIIFLSTNLGTDEDNNDINALDVLKRMKKMNSQCEVILYSDNDDINIVSSAFHFGAYTFIKKNDNLILRIENNILGIISLKNFLIKKESSRRFTRIFLLFVAGISISLIILYKLFPHWFSV